ncbi:Ribosomal RNA-processing protein 17 [Cytospora mali]|uniref:Ribosomal RNA-processing protein 17 n=1 Tax=Cytospora mali TaxID=578113 RepID=A0A194VIG9_CYTMA|nr:Ribosomal RNA-processing protein 17 [Valsa mali]
MFAKPRPKKSPLPPPSKKRKATYAVEEITFDNTARQEYLTGFHKRKVQRQKHAQEEAAKRAREERIVFRKQIREERKKEVEDHVKNVEAILKESRVAGLGSDEEEAEEGESDKEDDEWDGIDDAAPAPALEPVDHEEEYIDEDLYTTVKVEAVSVDRDGLHNKAELEAQGEDGEEEDQKKQKGAVGSNAAGKKGRNDEPKRKKKKFRYESKLERSLTNRKNKARKARPE